MAESETGVEVHAHIQHMRDGIRARVSQLTGSPADAIGVEVATLVRIVTNLYENSLQPEEGAPGLSGPRWAVLMRLLAAENENGAGEGLTPTYLSGSLSVSKNTISSLLRGLEDTGLIVRELDPSDRRLFRIRLSPEGRRLVLESAPRHVAHLNALASGLSLEELQQLSSLLEKLHNSILANGSFDGCPVHRAVPRQQPPRSPHSVGG